MPEYKFTNRLIHERSPYLLQHAHNPVDWYPWGKETLQRAKQEERPILLSVGYSACHWCHVMAEESFQRPEIAQVMNESFINIKVDREERPDIDHIYQAASQIIAGQGGWPLTVFLTPDQKPFYAGTYFPPQDRYGRPGFKRILDEIARLWRDNPKKIQEAANEIAEVLTEGTTYERTADPSSFGSVVAKETDMTDLPSDALIERLKDAYDHDNGGFGDAPKFPHANVLSLFLQESRTHPDLLRSVIDTLLKMARGGIYDQLGGGFHRYSTDSKWLLPHFEKMLYDNALLASLYLDAYQYTKNQELRNVALEILDYVLRDMVSPDGGFYSSEDADSEGEEGKFYVWRRDEILALLGEKIGEIVCRYYGVSHEGNFQEGASVLHRQATVEELAGEQGLGVEEIEGILKEAHKRLKDARDKRPHPGRDEKIIAAWNGMMISAFAKAGRILGDERYTGAARRAAEFSIKNLSFEDGRLRRSFKDGPGSIPGFLEDYAHLAAGFIHLYQATFDFRWLKESLRLTRLMVDLFWSREEGGFFDSPLVPSEESLGLFLRPRNPIDESYPSGMSIAACDLLLLSAILDEGESGEFTGKVKRLLEKYRRGIERDPWGFASFLSVANLYKRGLTQIVIVAGDDLKKTLDERTMVSRLQSHELVKAINDTYIPGLLLLGPSPKEADNPRVLAAWEGKSSVGGRTTAYVCRGFSCSPPITEAGELRRYLGGSRASEMADTRLGGTASEGIYLE